MLLSKPEDWCGNFSFSPIHACTYFTHDFVPAVLPWLQTRLCEGVAASVLLNRKTLETLGDHVTPQMHSWKSIPSNPGGRVDILEMQLLNGGGLAPISLCSSLQL